MVQVRLPQTRFQHTAARRRLVWRTSLDERVRVSTHNRPKAAGIDRLVDVQISLFQHTAARRRLYDNYMNPAFAGMFQHTAARRRLDC